MNDPPTKQGTRSEVVIFRMLDISTGHITEDSRRWLSESPLPMISREYEEGWWVHVNREDKNWLKELKKCGVPECIRAILKLALDNDCHYVVIDQAGTEYDFLPHYDW